MMNSLKVLKNKKIEITFIPDNKKQPGKKVKQEPKGAEDHDGDGGAVSDKNPQDHS